MTDALGRLVTVPDRVDRIICSGAGCLRLATYLKVSHMVVAVDSIEKRVNKMDARPYALAQPRYRNLPLFGEFRGNDNPELILSLNPAPQVIFKTGCTGDEAESLQTKTGIPVVALKYGNLVSRREDLYRSLTLMGEVTDVSSRAREVVDFFRESIQDLRKRSAEVDEAPSTYVGGIGFRGPHGLLSTEPTYPPFLFTGAENVAAQGSGAKARHAMVDREALLRWDPQVIFVDLSTLTASGGGALVELRDDPLWAELSAVKNRRLYGVLPYNWYSQNFGNILADAYFVGSVLFPERFADVDVSAKADDIYRFLVGEPVFKRLEERFDGRVFQRLELGR
ncbi:MAG: iron ABC transporter substrate-binding protein [Dethiosulfovibrio peptidovorans]|nr:MAG: iron ABC transporter substrate-binding protein [Dethiosulfovibrio peptidovorans]